MQNDLGWMVLIGMADQRWAMAFRGDQLHFWSPVTQSGRALPAALFLDREREDDLRVALLILQVHYGLVWDEDPRGGFPPFN